MKIKTICGNSLEVMLKVPDKYFDLIITDPPYNLGKDYGSKVNDAMSSDEYLEWSKQWFEQAKRIAKGIIFTPGWNQLKMWLTEIEYPKGIVVWYNKTQMMHSSLGGFNHWEPILVYGKINFGRNVIVVPVGSQKLFKTFRTKHPNPKPVKLITEILGTANPKPKRVLDPFMGIGTTLMSCKMLRISCLGIELNPEYVNEAEKYLKYYVERNITSDFVDNSEEFEWI